MSYDLIGFQNNYFLIAAFALVFWVASWFALSPTPVEMQVVAPVAEPSPGAPPDPLSGADAPLLKAGEPRTRSLTKRCRCSRPSGRSRRNWMR